MYVYIVVNKINGRKYIGMSINKKKWFRESYYGSGKLIKQAILKYGKDNFIKTIIKEFDNEYDCMLYERYLIEYNNAVDDEMYYNMAPGGYGGAHKGHVVSDETRKKISESNKGRTVSDETRKKMSDKVKGYRWKDEDIKKRAASIKNHWDNRTIDERNEVAKKISDSSKGKKLENSTKEKLSKINAKLSKEQVIEIYNFGIIKQKTYKEIGSIYGINVSSVWAIVNKVSYKWVWF